MQMAPLIVFQPARASPATDPASGTCNYICLQPQLEVSQFISVSTSGVSRFNHSPQNALCESCSLSSACTVPAAAGLRWFGSIFQRQESKFPFPSHQKWKKRVVTVLHSRGLRFAGGDVHCGSGGATPLFAFTNKSAAFDTTLSAAAQLMTRFSRRRVQRSLGSSAVAALKDWNGLAVTWASIDEPVMGLPCY